MVAQLTATDVDFGAAGRLSYGLVAGDDNQTFSVDEKTGAVSVNRPGILRAKTSYTLKVGS